ncbi:MAG: phosphoglucosamine mutase [Verrucomicrobia bacterium]|nr:phosphoglucosamine mutase [Verrucomicrobiota bacterium]MBU4291006.1 phosphoglucosamine mutase [Verrucomicrobiota bacterium]MBU4428639.1 phosphoglucosamine mutase [Verrucomicrobiota bacterium]MCG2680877.1 phosphoglucosamine mutase [Kiritimatiellia bacterium]
MGQLFGTDGVRGVANVEPMTAEMALAIGRATAHVCKRHNNRHRIVIGKDTRISGYMIETALTAGICSMGVDVLLVGPLPTPGIAFITHSMRADAGMVISASHNPYQDNGIKIFSRDGFKIRKEVEDEIESLITTEKIKDIRPTAAEIGKAHRIDDAVGRYIVFCKNTFPDTASLTGMKIVMDCANGATYKVAPIIFSELGAEVTTIHDHPNGMNINDHCGALYPEELGRKVLESGADVGLAFDGDGDRLIVIDEKGRRLNGDHTIAICAKSMKECGLLRNNLVITTAMNNYGFREAMKHLDIRIEEADVGDRYVLKMMREKGAVLGGEESGHIIFLNFHTTGDGIIAALQLLAILQDSGKKLSELAGIMHMAPQVLINVTVKTKPPLAELAPLQNALRKAEADLSGRGRVLVRYSGTQAICRVMVECRDETLTHRTAESLAQIVKQCIG